MNKTIKHLVGSETDKGLHVRFWGWDHWILAIGYVNQFPLSKHSICFCVGPVSIEYDWGTNG